MIAELVAEFQTATTSCCDINHCMLASELEQGLELGLRLEQGLEQGLGLELWLRLERRLEQELGLELGLRLEQGLEQGLGLELRLEQGLEQELGLELGLRLEQGLALDLYILQQQTAQPSCSGRYPVLLHVIFGQLIYHKQKQVHRGSHTGTCEQRTDEYKH